MLFGRADDIGEGGLFLVAAIQLKANDVIDLEFTLPYSSEPLRLRGLVRNRQGYGYGIEFLNPSEAERQQLLRMCQVLSILR